MVGRPRILTDEQRIINRKAIVKRNNAKRRLEHPEEHNAWERANYAKRKKEQPEWYLWKNSKGRANRAGIEHTIEIEDIVIPNLCPILQIPLFCSKGQPSPNSPTLDRIDNTKGYIPGNISVISHRANSNKGSMSITDVERLLNYMKRLPYE